MKRCASICLAVVLMISLFVPMNANAAAVFTDSKEIKHKEAVEFCIDLGMINGYPDGSFKPRNCVTRAEMCKILVGPFFEQLRDTYITESSEATFEDAYVDHWAYEYIEICVGEGIVDGMGDGLFHPSENLTGMQAAKMIMADLLAYVDPADYVGSNWKSNVMRDVEEYSLLDGLDIDMDQPICREDVLQMFMNAWEKAKI